MPRSLPRILLILAAAGAAAAGQCQPASETAQTVTTDLCVYGGNAAGIAAAMQMRRLGKDAAIVEFGRHLGGMTSAGLGATDIGNKKAIGGIAKEYYQRIRDDYYLRTYGRDSPQFRECGEGGFRFEPKAAELVFKQMAGQTGVNVFFEQRLKSVRKEGNRITEIEMENGNVFRAKVFLDASYEGDLMAKAGVSYTVGREANRKYGETLNGVQPNRPFNNFKLPVDPYVKPGHPESGLLPGISAADPGRMGEGDRRVQAYCFRLCLTDVPENLLPFPKPRHYDPHRYTLLARYLQARGTWDGLQLLKLMPNEKTDTNNFGAFSMDNVGANYAYPEADYANRERIFQDHLEYQQGLMYFLAHDSRVPRVIRAEVSQWGLAKDEFEETGGWPHQLYIREARRMVSDYVMTEHNCRGKRTVSDGVGLAAYTMDSHHCQRYVQNGRVLNEGDVQVGGFPPYPIAYRSIRPREVECANLLVPTCLSASHIAYGSIRMEAVFMVLGQSAATAADLAIDGNCPVQRIDVARLQQRLLADGQILRWQRGPKAAAPARKPTVAIPALFTAPQIYALD